MTEEEVVAAAIKDVLWANADSIFDGGYDPDPAQVVKLGKGAGTSVSALIARAAITAIDKHREEKTANEQRSHGEAMAARILADQKRWLAASPIQDDQEKER